MQQHRPDITHIYTLYKLEYKPYKNLATCSESSYFFLRLPAISDQRAEIQFFSGHCLQCQSRDFAYSHCLLPYLQFGLQQHHIPIFLSHEKVLSDDFFHLYHDSQEVSNSYIVRFCECFLLTFPHHPLL